MTEQSQPAISAETDTPPTQFIPPTVDKMLGEPPAKKPGRRSAADKADLKRRADYEALLEAFAALGQQVDALTQKLETSKRIANDWKQGYEDLCKSGDALRQEISANREDARLAQTTLSQLARLMHDAEFQTSLTENWDGTVTNTFTNKYGIFELVTTGDKLELKVTPADKKRVTKLFDLDSDGVPPNTVLMIQGHLGLPIDGPLTERAQSSLRNPEDGIPTDGLLFVMGTLPGDQSNSPHPPRGEWFDSPYRNTPFGPRR